MTAPALGVRARGLSNAGESEVPLAESSARPVPWSREDPAVEQGKCKVRLWAAWHGMWPSLVCSELRAASPSHARRLWRFAQALSTGGPHPLQGPTAGLERESCAPTLPPWLWLFPLLQARGWALEKGRD